MVSNENSIHITRGDTEFFEISLEDPEGNPYKLQDGDKVYLSVKQNIMTDEYAFQKVVDEFEDGVAKITIEPEDTKHMMFMDYVYDVQVTFKSGIVKTIIKPSKFVVGGEVTDE